MKHANTLLAATACLLAGCTNQTEYRQVENASMVVYGGEGGVYVPGLILQLSEPIGAVDIKSVRVITRGEPRIVLNAFTADAQGNPQVNGNYLILELDSPYLTEKMQYQASPFTYNLNNMHNEWADSYPVRVTADLLGADNRPRRLKLDKDLINHRISPDAALFNRRGKFSARYPNNLTKQTETQTLYSAAFEPEELKGGAKNPLIIWLHGQGEGGTDPDIAILGTETSALAKPPIQRYFKSGAQTGAYVLVVQTPTYWMDEGDGTNGPGSHRSRYSSILMDAIKNYVRSNPDIDTDRIYLGGDSNGGYMTMEMIIENPQYFAAAFPICEAYAYYNHAKNAQGEYLVNKDKAATSAFTPTDSRWFTDEKANKIKNLPIWFVQSADDTVVLPQHYALPTYRALLKAGAKNAWFSYFESVRGKDTGKRFMGHFSWVYVLNDQVKGVQNTDKIRTSKAGDFGFAPDDAGYGGTRHATFNGKTYDNLFDWLNAQKRRPAD